MLLLMLCTLSSVTFFISCVIFIECVVCIQCVVLISMLRCVQSLSQVRPKSTYDVPESASLLYGVS